MTFGPLCSAGWLHEHLGEPGLVVADMRWYLGKPDEGRANYLAGHIPGAVFADLDGELNGRSGIGRHPLPESRQFEAEMRRLGVHRGDRVVAYDDVGGSIAARLWFLLRWFGHPDVAVLDGGLQAWREPLETGDVTAEPGDYVAAEPPSEWILAYEDVAKLRDTVLLDARTFERYVGDVEPTGVRPGHIPGAKSAFWGGNLGPDGLFLSPAELRERYLALGAHGPDTVVYCGSGVTSAHDLLAMELAGLGGARLYAGSWSDWAVRPGAAIATGDET